MQDTANQTTTKIDELKKLFAEKLSIKDVEKIFDPLEEEQDAEAANDNSDQDEDEEKDISSSAKEEPSDDDSKLLEGRSLKAIIRTDINLRVSPRQTIRLQKSKTPLIRIKALLNSATSQNLLYVIQDLIQESIKISNLSRGEANKKAVKSNHYLRIVAALAKLPTEVDFPDFTPTNLELNDKIKNFLTDHEETLGLKLSSKNLVIKIFQKAKNVVIKPSPLANKKIRLSLIALTTAIKYELPEKLVLQFFHQFMMDVYKIYNSSKNSMLHQLKVKIDEKCGQSADANVKGGYISNPTAIDDSSLASVLSFLKEATELYTGYFPKYALSTDTYVNIIDIRKNVFSFHSNDLNATNDFTLSVKNEQKETNRVIHNLQQLYQSQLSISQIQDVIDQKVIKNLIQGDNLEIAFKELLNLPLSEEERQALKPYKIALIKLAAFVSKLSDYSQTDKQLLPIAKDFIRQSIQNADYIGGEQVKNIGKENDYMPTIIELVKLPKKVTFPEFPTPSDDLVALNVQIKDLLKEEDFKELFRQKNPTKQFTKFKYDTEFLMLAVNLLTRINYELPANYVIDAFIDLVDYIYKKHASSFIEINSLIDKKIVEKGIQGNDQIIREKSNLITDMVREHAKTSEIKWKSLRLITRIYEILKNLPNIKNNAAAANILSPTDNPFTRKIREKREATSITHYDTQFDVQKINPKFDYVKPEIETHYYQYTDENGNKLKSTYDQNSGFCVGKLNNPDHELYFDPAKQKTYFLDMAADTWFTYNQNSSSWENCDSPLPKAPELRERDNKEVEKYPQLN